MLLILISLIRVQIDEKEKKPKWKWLFDKIHANRTIDAFKIDAMKLMCEQYQRNQHLAQLSRFNNAPRHHYSFIQSVGIYSDFFRLAFF